MENFFEIFQNRVLLTSVASYFIAQVLKIIIILFKEKRLDWRLIFASGGMPSSHSSTVMALWVMCGLCTGWTSVETAISFVFAVIVMYDATGVRRAAGEQAKVLNEIVEIIEHRRMISGEKLKELVGHTPLQVVAGGILGLTIALISYYLT